MKYIFLEETDSTNNYLKARCGELDGITVVSAENQTAGKGRLGHSWAGDSGLLAMSILLKDPPEPETLTARVGLGVCEALGSALAKPASVGIKWPNDVIIANHKVCGILCESVRIGDCLNVVCGIGVNISQDAEFFANAGIPHGGSLKMLTGESPDKRELCRAASERVVFRCGQTFGECYEEYKKRVLNIGREVRLIRGSDEIKARAVDIAKNGFLICRGENGTFEVGSGEVSVRGTDGYL